VDKTDIWVAAVLFGFGLCAGSFVTALTWRIHQQAKKKKPDKNLSIMNGRSVCPACAHQLSALDLIPILSWAALRGKCRYCKRPISAQYPAVELAAGLIFTASYVFWPTEPSSAGQALLFVFWLLSSIGLLAMLVYDYRWMLLPNRILYPTAAAAVLGRTIYIALEEVNKWAALADWAIAVGIASGVFWLIFHISKGKWIGYGDVRLGLVTGTLLASPSQSLLMIFLASVLGTLFVLPSLLRGKRKVATRIPFGPFLIAATFIALLFGQSIINWYLDLSIQG
jgi:prepilin signal peptidase PulO-like enzyme (type II secretory pathway)